MTAKYRITKGEFTKKDIRGVRRYKVGSVVILNSLEAEKQAGCIELIEEAAAVRVSQPPIKPDVSITETEIAPFATKDEILEMIKGKPDGAEVLAAWETAHGDKGKEDTVIGTDTADVPAILPTTTPDGIPTSSFVEIDDNQYLDQETGTSYTLVNGILEKD